MAVESALQGIACDHAEVLRKCGYGLAIACSFCKVVPALVRSRKTPRKGLGTYAVMPPEVGTVSNVPLEYSKYMRGVQ